VPPPIDILLTDLDGTHLDGILWGGLHFLSWVFVLVIIYLIGKDMLRFSGRTPRREHPDGTRSSMEPGPGEGSRERIRERP